MKLSKKMIEAGWVIYREHNGSFLIYGSDNQQYHYNADNGTWSAELSKIEESLEKDVSGADYNGRQIINSPFVISSRLTALNHTKHTSQPVRYLCREGLAAGKSVLHIGTGLDRFAKRDLLASGCREVADYDPNFYPDVSVLDRQYDIVMAHYVLNILPPYDRHQIYQLIKKTLRSEGNAYLTVQGLWAVQHKYDILEPLEDGYRIRMGFNTIFRKGYSTEEFLQEITSEMGGAPRLLSMFYSNTLAGWTKP